MATLIAAIYLLAPFTEVADFELTKGQESTVLLRYSLSINKLLSHTWKLRVKEKLQETFQVIGLFNTF